MTSILMFLGFLIALTSRDLRIADCEARREVQLLTLGESLFGLKNRNLLKVGYLHLSRFLAAQGIVLTVFPLYLEPDLGLTVELIGIVIGMRAASMVVGTLVAGRTIARAGAKLLIAAGLLVMGPSYFIYSVIKTFEHAAPVTLLEGLGSGVLMVSLLVFLTDLATPSCRNSAVGVYRTFQDVGGFLGPNFFMFLYTSLSAHQTFWSVSALFIFNVIVTASMSSHRQKHLDRRLYEYRDVQAREKRIGIKVSCQDLRMNHFNYQNVTWTI